jgi:hypothetical protein
VRRPEQGGMAEKNAPQPTGMALVDGLADLSRPTLQDFVDAASEYVRECIELGEYQPPGGKVIKPGSRKKAGQIRLSSALGRALAADLSDALPRIHATAGETRVAGALRIAQMDVVEMSELDGLKLAVELKPVNLAVGRAIWNRYGDIRVGAVSTHLKFPFAVVGGVLTFPTWEWLRGEKRSTVHLVARAVELLRRAGNRLREDDAPHRLEGVGVVLFDPDTAALVDDLPAQGSGLRWEEFVGSLARAYDLRFAPDEATSAEEPSDPAELELLTLDDAEPMDET